MAQIMTKGKKGKQPMDKLLMQGIATVFFAMGLGEMTKEERKDLVSKSGVSDDELDGYLLGLFTEAYFKEEPK